MKIKKVILILFFISVISHSIFAVTPLDTNIFRYLPLKVGNVWIYRESGGFPYGQCYVYQRFAITGTSNINGKTYFQISFSYRTYDTLCQYYPNNITRLYSNMQIRLDSLTGNIDSYNCEAYGNVPNDSLLSRRGDSSNTCIGGTVSRQVCSDTSSVNILGMNKLTKRFFFPHASGGEWQSFAIDIGLYAGGYGESSYWWESVLKGCVINGVVYGDTNVITGIYQISSEIPNHFSLSQNFPNSFNPTTKIKFEIPSVGQRHAFDTQLIMYDILGREVVTLVNEQLQPGVYSVDWNASNFASGIYFYSLTTEVFSQTKKMVLIK